MVQRGQTVQQQLLRLLFCCLVLWDAVVYNIAMAATLTTDAERYGTDRPINLSWNYTSHYDGTGLTNSDTLVIVYNDTVPTAFNLNQVVQMFVFVSTLTNNVVNQTIRNIGSVIFDENDPDESSFQKWPLKGGHYKAHLIDSGRSNGTIYATSPTFTIFPFLSTNKQTYLFNESIHFSWDYTSLYTGTNIPNEDIVGIFNSSAVNFSQPIMYVWVSSLGNTQNNATIRNIGTVTFDGQPPDESGIQTWPLQAGSYQAALYENFRLQSYAEAITFTVLPEPPTKAPTKTPTKTPTKSPTKRPTSLPTKAPSTTSPSTAPIRKKKQLFCNIFLLKEIFCSDGCGFIGRLFNKC